MAIISVLALAGCNPATKDSNQMVRPIQMPKPFTANINEMKWLAGTWQNVSVEQRVFEKWTEVDATTLHGESGYIKGTDTVISETISLEQRGSDIYYIPTVKDQNEGKPVTFKLVSVAGNNFVFENQGHDYPQKITYTRKTPLILLAKISGRLNGKQHTEFFPMNRAQ